MANLCEKLLTECIGADCNNPIYTGIDSVAWIGNKAEAVFTYDENDPNVITNITMATYGEDSNETDAVLYTVQQLGKSPYANSTSAFEEGNTFNKMTHNFAFVVPDNSPKAAAILDNLMNGKFFAIVKNEYTGSDGRGQFEVIGAKKGLVCSDMNRDPYSEDTDGGWTVVLTETGAPNSALFLEHTDTSGDNPVIDTEAYLATLTADCE